MVGARFKREFLVSGSEATLTSAPLPSEQLDRSRMTLFRSPHQCRCAAQFLFDVQVGFVIDQHFDRVDVAISRREHEGVSPFGRLIGSAPAFSSFSIIGALPLMEARDKAVAPSLLGNFTFAPALIRSRRWPGRSCKPPTV